MGVFMQQSIARLQELHPHYTFIQGETFRWNPREKIIEYDAFGFSDNELQLLIHEIGHAELKHFSFDSDIDLIRKEVAAWSFVRQNASKYHIQFKEDLAENCLDSYRAWLDQRSSCPECELTGYQIAPEMYECINCKSQWSVSGDQQTRVCRRQINKLTFA